VIRCSLALQRFSFGISFIPGEKNVVADTLSRAAAGAPHELHAICFTDFFETYPSASDEWCQWGAGFGNGSPSADFVGTGTGPQRSCSVSDEAEIENNL
jgi:hypothetical protein